MAVFLQFQQDAFPVNLQKLFRVILGRKTIFFIYFNSDIATGEKLLFDLLFHRKNIFLLYQTIAGQINPHKILLFRSRYPFYTGLLKQTFQLVFQF